MLPPDKPLEEIPVVLYHWGGVIVNMSVALLAFVVWYVVEDPSPLLAQFLVMMCFAGVSLGCFNGIPFKRGISNDAANVRLMRKYRRVKGDDSPAARQCLYTRRYPDKGYAGRVVCLGG